MDIKKIESFRDLLQNYQTFVNPTGVSWAGCDGKDVERPLSGS
jgi:hypothetical protein